MKEDDGEAGAANPGGLSVEAVTAHAGQAPAGLSYLQLSLPLSICCIFYSSVTRKFLQLHLEQRCVPTRFRAGNAAGTTCFYRRLCNRAGNCHKVLFPGAQLLMKVELNRSMLCLYDGRL